MVKDQISCGSCWAHTTVAAIETMHAISNRTVFNEDVISLSEQQLVDCDLIPNMGCIGGQAKYAYKYVKQNGLALFSDYPYIDKMRECRYTDEMKLVSISEFKIFERIL